MSSPTDPRREAAIAQFLRANGFAPEDAEPLAQDASFRRYLRVKGGRMKGGRVKGGAVLMDAPPPEDTGPFLRIAAHLAALGLSVPRILAADETAGLILEEDLGDNLFSAVLSDANIDILFDAAIDALLVFQRAAPPSGIPNWGRDEMVQTATGTLFDWWWPAMHGAPPPDAVRAEITGALETMLAPLAASPCAMVHRDYFAGNLIYLPERTPPRRAGIIDFQTAALGHPAYDLVSLLQDARRDIPWATESRALARYFAARPDLAPDSFRAAYDACAAQRHLRVACQWVRLARRDARPEYLAYGPRVWAHLNRALAQPAAAPLAAALHRWIPFDRRRNPPGQLA